MHLNFRYPEFDSVLSLHNIDRTGVYDTTKAKAELSTPCQIVTFENDEVAMMVVSRCVLIHRVMRLWGHGESANEAANAIKDATTNCNTISKNAKTFSIEHETFGRKKTPLKEQVRSTLVTS